MLDQNFPLSPAGMRFEYLDRSVTLTHFNAAFPAYARVSTADWKMYLLAKSAGFDAVVTSDHNQLGEDTEMVVLQLAKLGLITWRKGEPDTVVLYGQLLAYLPGIVRELRRQPASVFVLPSASLRRNDHVRGPRDIARERQHRDGISYPERRAAALRVVERELQDTADAHLLSVIR